MIYNRNYSDYTLEELLALQEQFIAASISHLLVDRAGYLFHVPDKQLHDTQISVARLILERTMGL